MPNKTHRAPPRYKIPDFFSSLLVLRDVAISNVQCARSPSAVCMYSIRKGNTSSETVRFDVRTGKRIGPSQTEPLTNWSLWSDVHPPQFSDEFLRVIVLVPSHRHALS